MIEQDLEATLHKAFIDARVARHESVTLEHLLLGLLDNEKAQNALHACLADINELRRNLADFIKANAKVVPGTAEVDSQPTMSFQRVIQRAIMHVQHADKPHDVTGADILAALYGEKDSHAVYCLHQQSITRLDVMRFIGDGTRKTKEKEPEELTVGAKETEGDKKEESPLTIYTQNLNEHATAGKIDPLIGRELEIDRVIEILCRRRKNNPLLVGDAGVGKTAIAEGLAYRITQGDVPDFLKDATVYVLDLGALMAGAKYRGDFEQRIKSLLSLLSKDPQAILFIDEIHTIIGAGSAASGSLDASNLLKPALSRGELRCIGATTFNEYRNIFEKDHALTRRFQKIDVVEPTIEQTIQILKGLKQKFEDHHQVKYAHAALVSAAELSARFINERRLPDKAIDIIDEAGAAQRVLPKSKQKKTIGKSEIEEIIAKVARIPAQTVNQDDKTKLKNLETDLKNVVFGQNEAIEALASSIKMARAGLGKIDKPIGCFLFAGPTGVGKTEVARQLAFTLGIDLIRFDMSEYMERHAVSRLIGAPPGYVGFDQGGQLTEAITQKPHAVLLLDEIEKAHPDIFSILLQVMDHGTLTDSNGRQADFRNIIIIMTTNAGAKDMPPEMPGFPPTLDSIQQSGEIKRIFTPEFRNRLDAIINFHALDEDVILKVVDKFLKQLEEQLRERKVDVVFTQALRKMLAQKGFDPEMGARPMLRLIQDLIRRALAEELLFGRLASGGFVTVDIDDQDKVILDFDAKKQEELVLH